MVFPLTCSATKETRPWVRESVSASALVNGSSSDCNRCVSFSLFHDKEVKKEKGDYWTRDCVLQTCFSVLFILGQVRGPDKISKSKPENVLGIIPIPETDPNLILNFSRAPYPPQINRRPVGITINSKSICIKCNENEL